MYSLYNGMHCIKVLDHIIFTTLWSFHLLKVVVVFFAKTFNQMHIWYIVKQQYNPLNALCFIPHCLFIQKFGTTLTEVYCALKINENLWVWNVINDYGE